MACEITNETHGYTLSDNLRISPPIMNILPPRTTSASLGALEAFPREVLDMVVSQLDLKTIVRFRGVNFRAREVADNHQAYSTILKHAPKVLCALHQSRRAVHTTCGKLYTTLLSRKCERCRMDGVYLQLFTCTRVCWRCFNRSLDFLPIQPKAAAMRYALNYQILKPAPRIKVAGGQYGLGMPFDNTSRNIVLLDRRAAKDVAVARYGSAEAWQSAVEAKRLLQPLDGLRPVVYPDEQMHWWRYCVVARIPWVSKRTRAAY
ncbi:hypothetical protein K4F52_004658 [Lecanicillium sp. MT-2017a]|nr:hypothetical protein K4F52_004658 [Lecanicillium sp. MT-2017a]